MLRALDLALLRFLRTRGHAARAERAVLAFTRAGEHGLLWQVLCTLGLVLDPARGALYRRTMRATMLAYLANILLKYVVRRPRPVLEGLPALSSTVTSLSYPSAHTTTSFAAAGGLSQGLPAPPLYACAGAMALSRAYTGVHYPSDIVAGAVFGTALGELMA
ncbi:MAG: phosphatase PAP2 family protein [Actinomycetota bacterium]|nr:phosphatase PAP2 family protein [Actinomycetota bacterium]